MFWGPYNTKTYVCYSNSSEANWTRFKNLLSQATQACRDVCPEAKIIIHTELAGDSNILKDIYTRLATIDYDIIGLSYYPFWHKSLSTLSSSLNMLESEFPNKKVQIVETAYYYQGQPAIGQGIDYDFQTTWPISPEGQVQYTQALIAELKTHENVNGLYWWFPEENGNGPNNQVSSYWVNRGLWDNETHKALPALYELKHFNDDGDTGLQAIESQQDISDNTWYAIDGKRLANTPSKCGIYINEGKKKIIR